LFSKTQELIAAAFRDHHEANPTLPLWKYEYTPGQGYSGLRGHIERYHEEEYLKACQDNGWRVMLPSWLKKEKADKEVALQDSSTARTVFTPETFLQHLINWIVADDQVRPIYLKSDYILANVFIVFCSL
jgi:hypothetical protein